MLYGNFVVIDHNDLSFFGHVVTIYAHLHEVDPGIRLGQTIPAGQRVGQIGNQGTPCGRQRGLLRRPSPSLEDPHR